MAKIALLIPTLDRIGGAEKQLLLLAPGLSERGYAVSVITLSGDFLAAGDLLDGIRHFSLGMRHGVKDPRGWWRLAAWIWRERPEIVHTHLPHSTWLARWIRLIAPVPVVVDTIHTSARGTWGRRVGYRVSNWLTNQTTAVSKTVAESWLSAQVVRAEKLTVVPNGVVLPVGGRSAEEGAQTRRAFSLRDEDFLWLAVGRLEAVKDFSTLLRAFALLREKAAHLAIAGAGVEEAALKLLTEELGLKERVHWLGFVKELAPYYAAADGFVQSSRWEGLPVAVLEAGASGLAIAATDCAGMRDALPDAGSEFLAQVGDAEALASKMSLLMGRSASERKKIGEMNFKFVSEDFSMERILDEWESLYGALLKKTKLPRE